MSETWWGLRAPDETEAAWGARAIDDGKTFGLLPDRQSMRGGDDDRRKLAAKLNGGVLAACQKRFGGLKDSWLIAGDVREEHTLYEDDEVKVIANTNASYGYLYLAAWLKEQA